MQPIKDPFIFEKKEILGIPVYSNYLPQSPCIHIALGFKVGSLDDPIGKEGLAHFVEHVVFNGSPLLPTPKLVRDFKKKYTIDTFNAHTGYWDTEYVAKCLPEHFKETLEGMIDLVFNPLIEEKESARERNVIIQEIWDRYRNKKLLEYRKEYIKNTKPNLPSNRMWSPGGWPDTVPTIEVTDLKEWHTSHYQSGNLYILLTGAVQNVHIEMLNELLSSVPRGERTSFFDRNIIVQKPLINEISYNSKDIGLEKDHATLTIVRNTTRDVPNEEMLYIASEFFSAILFETLREELGLCYSVFADCEPGLDHISNHIHLGLSKENLALAEEKIFEILKDIEKGSYKEKFLQEKTISIDQLRAAERTAHSIIESASYRLIVEGDIIPLQKIIADREAVTYDQVASYLCSTFKKEDTYIETILP